MCYNVILNTRLPTYNTRFNCLPCLFNMCLYTVLRVSFGRGSAFNLDIVLVSLVHVACLQLAN